jgi:hypothetical protein
LVGAQFPKRDNVNNAPDDFVVESITLTTTTTVFGNCAPTNPVG